MLAKLAEMGESDRVIGERLHAIIKASAPSLSAKLWYGMPAYAKDGKIVCHFQPADKFKTRYATSASAMSRTWTTAPCGRSFALPELTATEKEDRGTPEEAVS